MKVRIFLVALGVAVSAGCSFANAQTNELAESEVQTKVKQAKVHAKALGRALKSRLKQAIQSGGLEAGVEECKLAAEPIAEGLSQNGWEVGRTALKVRNPNNAPDEWEREQLALFASLLKKTELESKPPSTPIDTYKYDSDSGEFRYMMAIQQGQVCMACHGGQVAPSVKETILKHYPQDEATGFELGELRGAFTLTYSPQ
ncbi:DUF3365 domain-containing protein [Alteromonas gracilis]|uniref:Tll0287-like domain-containing protein n=1 Tax=Alteromonas gracilis TaxID=1479524 RepID=UPI0036F2F2E8